MSIGLDGLKGSVGSVLSPNPKQDKVVEKHNHLVSRTGRSLGFFINQGSFVRTEIQRSTHSVQTGV